MAGTPIDAFYLVGENNLGDRPGRDRYLEWIALHAARNGTAEHQLRLAVIDEWGKNHGGSPASLFMPTVRRKVEPHQVTPLGNIACRQRSSLPTGRPNSTESWRLFGLIRSTSSARVYRRALSGLIRIAPFFVESWTRWFSVRFASFST